MIIWILVSLCIAASVFFRFALIGYGFISLTFAFLAAVMLFFKGLRELQRRGKIVSAVKAIRIAAIILLCMGLILFAVLETEVISGARTDAVDADYLIVLGAGLHGREPSLSLKNRLDATLDYMQSHPESMAVLSGGKGEGEQISEAEAMRIYLCEHGISGSRLLMEDKATTTEENILFSMGIISDYADLKSAKIAIVSSEYHLYRARLMARDLGCDATGVAAHTTLPVLKINYFIREAFALLHYKVLDW